MTGNDTLESVQEIVARLFDLPTDQINCDAPIKHIKGWDSILQLTLVLEIEDEYGYPLTQDDLRKCNSIRDYAELVDQHNESRRQ